MATKVAYWTGSIVGYIEVSDSGSGWDAAAQRFTLSESCNIAYVILTLERLNVATTLTVAIYNRDNGNPTTSLGSKTIDISGWPQLVPSQRTITFDSPISVSAGNYAIVLTEGSNYSCGWGYSGAGVSSGAIRRKSGTWYELGTPARGFWHEVWATQVPSKPTNPTPGDTSTSVGLAQQTISWEDGGGADSYNVYYGTESGDLTLLESGVIDTEYTIFQITNGSPFDYEVTRYWRIDAVNEYGTTTGDEWSFTTITFNVPAAGIRGGTLTVADGETNVKTRLVAFARNKVWYEDV